MLIYFETRTIDLGCIRWEQGGWIKLCFVKNYKYISPAVRLNGTSPPLNHPLVYNKIRCLRRTKNLEFIFVIGRWNQRTKGQETNNSNKTKQNINQVYSNINSELSQPHTRNNRVNNPLATKPNKPLATKPNKN